MTPYVDPRAVARAAARAAAGASQSVGLFAESSSAMFYATRALSELEDDPSPYTRMSVHYGSMGHALAGAVGFCVATGQRAIVLTGDGSLQLMNPVPVAVKHGLALTIVVLNDQRLGLPFFGSGRIGASHAQSTTGLADWDFAIQGSPLVGVERVTDEAKLDGAIATALEFGGPYVIDVKIDPGVVPPVGARLDSVEAMFGGTRR